MAAALPPLAKAGYTRKEAYDRLAQVALLARLSTKTPEAVAGMIADIRDGKAGPRKLQSFFGAAISSVPRAATDEEEAALGERADEIHGVLGSWGSLGCGIHGGSVIH